MACDEQRAALTTLQNQVAAIETEIQHMPPANQAAAQAAAAPRLVALADKIAVATAALNKCIAANETLRVPGAQPSEILQIQYQNPAFTGTGTDWAATLAGGTFPGSQGKEWLQILNPADEYDRDSVGATGWAVAQDTASNDAIGLHPFGNDWEFLTVLDPQFLPLLSKGSASLSSGSTFLSDLGALNLDATDAGNATSQGVLGVEWDSRLVPPGFQVEFNEGDRVAVFGRWIVDCGHNDFHTEIHPPLMLASACVYHDPIPPSGSPGQFTRALITSRPYLVGQTFTTSTDDSQLYNDSSGDDGYFLAHMLNEIRKAETAVLGIPLQSLQVEAHPKIKQWPFQGIHIFEMTVKASQKPPIIVTQNFHLAVSFQFTTRAGCSVQVTANDSTSVRVYVVMNSTGYTPPALPNRNEITYSISDLNSAAGLSTGDEVLEGIVAALNAVIDPAGTAVLARGVKTDLYDPPPPVNYLKANSTNAVINANASAIPAGQGITVDNNQPYPITGWIEVGYVTETEVNAPLNPVNPVNPTNPIIPVHPIDPIAPIKPVLPVEPVKPIIPNDPVKAAGPLRTPPKSEE